MTQKGARLGQHFLSNPHYAAILVRESHITDTDTVLEIGPGKGMLTKEILKCAKKVLAVEKDEVLAQELHTAFASDIAAGRLEIFADDIRNKDPETLGLTAGAYILAANIPYYITGELLRKFLEARAHPKTISFLMQKEVADRILSEKESILSISVKVYGTPRVAAKVTKGNFSPPPKVDSAILVIEEISKKNFLDLSEEKFFEVVRAGFSSKRKMLLNNLSAKFGREKTSTVFAHLNIPLKLRAEDLPLEHWLKLAKNLSS